MTGQSGVPATVADHVRHLWQQLAGEDTQFPTGGSTQVVLAPGARLCPQGWLGIVSLDGSTLVTAPDTAVLGSAHALTHVDPRALTDPDVVRSLLPVERVLGPARLAYLPPGALVAAGAGTTQDEVETLPPGHPDVTGLLERAGEADADESGIAEVTSETFVVRRSGRVVAASGYRRWPAEIAHLCVLTDPALRGNGLATRVAGAATRAATDDGLLPQWRGASRASIGTARALGYVLVGAQLSVALRAAR